MFDHIASQMYNLVHDVDGGAAKLAALTNMNAGTLQNKVNPTMENHHLTLKEAVLLMNTTHDYRLLHTVCKSLGFVCVPVDAIDGVSDMEFLSIYSNAIKEVGELSQAINSAFDDGKISRQEVELVKLNTIKAMTALAELPSRLKSMCDE